MIEESKDWCAECGLALAIVQANEQRPPCPVCGATGRRMLNILEDSLVLGDSIEAVHRRPSLKSDQKWRGKSFSGLDYSHSRGKLVRKELHIDRDADKYFERITDLQTGEVIHECDEALSQHRGHGSAKRKSE